MMMDTPETDKLLGELFRENAPWVNEEALRKRVAARSPQKWRNRPQARRTRVLVVAFASVALVAAIGYGAYSAATHFQEHPVLVLTDSTAPVTVVAGSTTSSTDVSSDLGVQARVQLMTSASLQLTAAGKTFTLTPDEVAAALDYTPWYGAQFPSVPHLSAAKLSAFLARVAPAVETAAVNATFDTDGTKVWVVPGTDGTAIDADRTAVALSIAALTTNARTAEVVTKAKEPDLTTAEAQAMGVKDLLARYTTEYTGTMARRQNVKLTTQYASNVLLAPGQEYDFDKQIGPRTVALGWQLAPGITGPGDLEDVLGGGIAQVSTTLFNAVFEAGLEVTERHNLSIYISHYPKGRDATVTGGGKNLRFANDTDHTIWIHGSSDGITTTITIYGTDDGRRVTTATVSDFYNIVPKTTATVDDPSLPIGETSVIAQGQVGRELKTHRVVTRNGVVIHDDTWVSSWPMFPEEVAVGTKGTTTAP